MTAGQRGSLAQHWDSSDAKRSRSPAWDGADIPMLSSVTANGSFRPKGSLRPHPHFPNHPPPGPLPLWRRLQSTGYRVSSFFLSLSFLGVIVAGALATSTANAVSRTACRLVGRRSHERPFRAEEQRRHKERRAQEKVGLCEHDPLICDVGYYARRVGLDVETYTVQTEDGFIIDLWHVYDPAEYRPRAAARRGPRGPGLLFDELDDDERTAAEQRMFAEAARKHRPSPRFPVLLVHGLLQNAGAFCAHDDDSLAFFLCKAGYDVWLGNNRCGMNPRHVALDPSDPRMWAWDLRHMGALDLPALASRVLRETRFSRLALIGHSQGTAQALVALARAHRPALGRCLTVMCALAPAAYAGPLLDRRNGPLLPFRLLSSLSPAAFRLVFGVHAFVPIMMHVRPYIPRHVFSWLGYCVFSFLFGWTDQRWDRDLRDRMFQFAPVYVSATSMNWWLGPDGFAHQQCILDNEVDKYADDQESATTASWYDEQVPPLALWVGGKDNLVDGRRLLARLLPPRPSSPSSRASSSADGSELNRSLHEPHVRVVHAKVLPEFGHLDIIWAMDAVDQVFTEVRDVLWKTCPVRDNCRVPIGCEKVEAWEDDM